MIVCPKCDTELTRNYRYYECKACNYRADENDGIIFFNPEISVDHKDYHAKILDNIYQVEKRHFWFLNRKRIIHKIFNKYISKEYKIIEIGAGTGSIAGLLLEHNYDVSVGEIHINGLKYAQKYNIDKLYQFDLFSPPFKNHFDVVCMFDVIEHFDDDDKAIDNAKKILKDYGTLVLSVPAHGWLWSRDDNIACHKRRYNLKKIKSLLKDNGFEIIVAKHFFLFILPLLLLRKLINPSTERDSIYFERKVITLNPILNKLLDILTKIEFFIFQNITPRFGGSIIAVAKHIKLL